MTISSREVPVPSLRPGDSGGLLAAGFDPAIIVEIDARLDGVSAAHGVAIPWAIESGSRAWGFPSPDSDYDCRFVCIRTLNSYLALFPPRDVIETPLTAVIDVNGWDLAKAIRLLLKGNAVIVEWLTSPLVYRGDPAFRDDFLALALEAVDRGRIARHYLHLAYSMRKRVFDGEEAKLKKLFYVLRPAIALRWLRQRPSANIAPMNFPTLCAQADLPPTVDAEIAALIERKATTRELGSGVVPPSLRALIENEIAAAETAFAETIAASPRQIALADAFFRRAIDRFGPAAG